MAALRSGKFRILKTRRDYGKYVPVRPFITGSLCCDDAIACSCVNVIAKTAHKFEIFLTEPELEVSMYEVLHQRQHS